MKLPTETIQAELAAIVEARNKATPGEWNNRCNEFSNSARPRFIWDSTWGFIGEMNSGSQDIVNAEFIALAANRVLQLTSALELAIDKLKSIDETTELVCYNIRADEAILNIAKILTDREFYNINNREKNEI